MLNRVCKSSLRWWSCVFKYDDHVFFIQCLPVTDDDDDDDDDNDDDDDDDDDKL